MPGHQDLYPEGETAMAKTHIVDPQGIIRVVDTETLVPVGTYGAENMSKTDYLSVTANGATLATGHRTVDLKATNGDSDVANVSIRLQTKGAGLFFPPALATASFPAWASWMAGAVMFDSTTNKLMLANGAAWVVVGSQS